MIHASSRGTERLTEVPRPRSAHTGFSAPTVAAHPQALNFIPPLSAEHVSGKTQGGLLSEPCAGRGVSHANT